MKLLTEARFTPSVRARNAEVKSPRRESNLTRKQIYCETVNPIEKRIARDNENLL
jgi:hypothetical protein